MNKLLRPLTILGACCAVSFANAQFTETVLFDDFNSYTDNSFVVASQELTTLVTDGSGGNAIQFSTMTGAEGGFFAQGFDWEPTVQPGPGGPNTSTELADYQISFDLTVNSDYIVANAFEIWVKDEVVEGDSHANLYSVSPGTFTTGVTETVSFTLDDPDLTDPFGYPGGAFTPTIDQWRIRINGLDFGSPQDTEFTFTVDNFELTTVPEPSTVGLLLGSVAVTFAVYRRRKS